MKKNGKPVLDITNIDRSVKPGNDFYQHAIGNWLKNNPIPQEYSSWGSFNVLAEENLNVLKGIMEKAKGRGPGEQGTGDRVEKMVGDFYASGMDERKIESEGLKPLEKELERIDKIKDLKKLVTEIAHMHQLTADPLFNLFVAPDAKKSDVNIAELYQGGLNLPDRDYYLKDDQYSKEIRAKYQDYIANIFKLMRMEKASKEATVVLMIETKLAKISRDKVLLRDPNKNYNPMTLAALSKMSGKFDWALYFRSLGVTSPGKLNIGQPEFFKGISKLLTSIPIEEWQIYLKFCLVNDNAELLSSVYVNEEFNFYGKTMNGSKVLMPRWKRVAGVVNGCIDQAVGKLFVKERFSPKAKERSIEMVRNIRSAFRERIKKLDWMGDKTKQAALKKLSAMTFKIGYPDKWKDYSKLEIKNDSYVLNVMRASYFEFQRDIKKIGKKVDKTEWHMPPQIVNAGYMPQQNDMLFPAGILQPPFFNADADDAVNYGAIGTIIAHEMTHGFDDQGGKFDAKGDLKDWWTKQDALKFGSKTKGLIDQFGSYEPFPGMKLNGKLTLGENIADLGGITISFGALKKLKDPGLIDGFTREQRFFLAYAQIWHTNMRDERAKMLIKIDPHSPAKFRVNGSLSNFAPFYAAFNVVSGEAMYKPEGKRNRVW